MINFDKIVILSGSNDLFNKIIELLAKIKIGK